MSSHNTLGISAIDSVGFQNALSNPVALGNFVRFIVLISPAIHILPVTVTDNPVLHGIYLGTSVISELLLFYTTFSKSSLRVRMYICIGWIVLRVAWIANYLTLFSVERLRMYKVSLGDGTAWWILWSVSIAGVYLYASYLAKDGDGEKMGGPSANRNAVGQSAENPEPLEENVNVKLYPSLNVNETSNDQSHVI